MPAYLLVCSNDVLLVVCSLLSAKDVLGLRSACRRLKHFTSAGHLWEALLGRDYGHVDNVRSVIDAAGLLERHALDRYVALHRYLGVPAVAWTDLPRMNRVISRREGHDMCVLHNGTIFLRFGFVNDAAGYVVEPDVDVQRAARAAGKAERSVVGGDSTADVEVEGSDSGYVTTSSDGQSEDSGDANGSEEERNTLGITKLQPATVELPQLYGIRLCAIGERRVAQFGGFRHGGYRGAVNCLVFTDLFVGENNKQLRDATVIIPVPPRAYHAQCVGQTGRDTPRCLWIHGGLLEGRRCSSLYRVDVAVAEQAAASTSPNEAKQLAQEAVTALGPSPMASRFGHTMAQVGDQLFIAGGYTGTGVYMLHDGRDLHDIHAYSIKDHIWREITPKLPLRGVLGRCHTVCRFGTSLVFFGGTVDLSNRLAVFDTVSETVTVPSCRFDTTRRRWMPLVRLSHAAVVVGTRLFVFGGWNDEFDAIADAAVCSLVDVASRSHKPALRGHISAIADEEPEASSGDEDGTVRMLPSMIRDTPQGRRLAAMLEQLPVAQQRVLLSRLVSSGGITMHADPSAMDGAEESDGADEEEELVELDEGSVEEEEEEEGSE